MTQPYFLEVDHLLKINAGIRQRSIRQVAELADLGRLHQIGNIYRRYVRRSFFELAAFSGLCIGRYRPFDECNRRTAGEVVLFVLNIHGYELTLDYLAHEEFQDVLCRADTHIEEVTCYLLANSRRITGEIRFDEVV